MYAISVRMGVSPSYFLDEMEQYELKAIIKESENQYKEEYERTRMIMHSIYQSQNSKSLDYEDVLKFPWDIDEKTKILDPEEKERLKKYVLELQDKMNSK